MNCTAARPLAAVVFLAAMTSAQDNWSIQSSAANLARGQSALAYDTARSIMILYGGTTGAIKLGDTWMRTDTSAWQQLQPVNSPGPRDGHAMCFDEARMNVILFGGLDINNVPLGDTWRFANNNWAQLTATGPSARYSARMSYDSMRGRSILFGGYAFPTAFNETWEFNGATWAQVATPNRPAGRDSHAQAYHPASNRTIVFGGLGGQNNVLGDTWAFNGLQWSQLAPANSPSARTFLAMSSDLIRGVLLLFGGTDLGVVNNFSDSWAWNGSNWTQLMPATSPTGRDSHVQYYDSRHGVHVLVGGYDPMLAITNEVWSYGRSGSATYATYGQGCPGSAGVPELRAMAGSLPRLNTTLQTRVTNLPASAAIYLALGFSNASWLGVPLPVLLSTYGMPGCTAYVSVDVGMVLFGTGGQAFYNLPIPNNPSLIGTTLYQQAVSLDPGAGNPAMAVTSNAARAVVGQ